MKEKKDLNLEEILKDHEWKNKNQKYILDLDKFFDLVDNVKQECLRRQIRTQMIRCDKNITKMAEEIFKKMAEE